jgi:hypothetical protein
MRRRLVWVQGVTKGNFAIISYQWQPPNGTDLDTRTKLLIPDFGTDVGWNRGSTISGTSGPYLAWQGDNTGTSGSEDVWIYFENIKADFEDELIQIRLRAFWYGTAGNGQINVKTRLWETFDSFQAGDPPMSDIDRTQQLTTSDVRADIDGENVGVLTYNRNTSAIAYINP